MRTRYVLRNGELVEKDKAGPIPSLSGHANVISDIKEFKTQDGVPITSRSDLREYEKRMGVRQVGTDWTGSTRPRFWDVHLERRKGATIEYRDLTHKR